MKNYKGRQSRGGGRGREKERKGERKEKEKKKGKKEKKVKILQEQYAQKTQTFLATFLAKTLRNRKNRARMRLEKWTVVKLKTVSQATDNH